MTPPPLLLVRFAMPFMGITSGLQADMATVGIMAMAAGAVVTAIEADTDAPPTMEKPASLFLSSLAAKSQSKSRSNPATKFQQRVVAR